MKKKKSLKFRLIDIIVILFCIAGFLFSGSAFWKEYNRTFSKLNEKPIGTITFKKRTVQRKLLEHIAWDRLREESAVYNGDVIRTIEVSETTITFRDLATRLMLGEKTMIQVFYDDEKGARVDFSGGNIFVESGGRRLIFTNGSTQLLIEGQVNVEKTGEGLIVSVIEGTVNFEGRQLSSGGVYAFGSEGKIETIAGSQPDIELPFEPVAASAAAVTAEAPMIVSAPQTTAAMPAAVSEPAAETQPPAAEIEPVDEKLSPVVALWPKNRPAPVSQSAVSMPKLTPTQMVYIKGGTFTMGSPEDELPRNYSYEILHDENEGPQHRVMVSSFFIGKYEVTQKEYKEVMGINPSIFIGDRFPVENISWYDAVEYCNKRSQMEGMVPAYIIEGGYITWNRNAGGYRLPTEAEWEYACRAGTMTPFNTGKEITTDQAHYDGRYPYTGYNESGRNRRRTTSVGSFSPNLWGLYDMHGNVAEWCWDGKWVYIREAQTDPVGMSSTDRVIRGGDWGSPANSIRSAHRKFFMLQNSTLGFRVARNAQ